MNLEQIDTSTTAGKAEVMRLAAAGRQLLVRSASTDHPWEPIHEAAAEWGWRECEYAIQSELVGSPEVWVVFTHDFTPHTEESAKAMARREGGVAVSYIRADLAGEVRP